jgi:hypothetical protein
MALNSLNSALEKMEKGSKKEEKDLGMLPGAAGGAAIGGLMGGPAGALAGAGIGAAAGKIIPGANDQKMKKSYTPEEALQIVNLIQNSTDENLQKSFGEIISKISPAVAGALSQGGSAKIKTGQKDTDFEVEANLGGKEKDDSSHVGAAAGGMGEKTVEDTLKPKADEVAKSIAVLKELVDTLGDEVMTSHFSIVEKAVAEPINSKIAIDKPGKSEDFGGQSKIVNPTNADPKDLQPAKTTKTG